MGQSNLKNSVTSVISTTGIVAQNLLIAHTTLGWAQQRLASASGVSRGTIAQLEAGIGDPRLSTLELLVRALRISSSLLLFNEGDFRAVTELPAETPHSPAERRSLEALDRASRSPHYRSRLEAALQGVNIVTQAGLTGAAQLVGAAIGSARLASRGTFLGANLAHLMHHYQSGNVPEPKSHPEENDVRFLENI